MSQNRIQFQKGNLEFHFLLSGDIDHIKYQHIRINQLKGNYLDGSLMNIYLRIKQNHQIKYTPLIGIHSPSTVSFNQDCIVYSGVFCDMHYTVTFAPATEQCWFWKVTLEGDGSADLVFAQDLALASEGAVNANEAYVCQYIDHAVTKHDTYGYTITSRQNQPENGQCPTVQHGCFSGADHFSTDGYQFYGTSYRETNQPACLSQPTLCDDNYQYEFALAALQTTPLLVTPQQKQEIVFYASFQNHTEAGADQSNVAAQAYQTYQNLSISNHNMQQLAPIQHKPLSHLCGDTMTPAQTAQLHDKKRLLEAENDTELSYFTSDYAHVVTKAKELLVERPHGCIAQTGHDSFDPEHTIATTFFMNGVFQSQIVLGNTTFHKLISNVRNHLNIFKNTGQRIWIENDEGLQLLTLPSLFEMGVNYGRWLYQTEQDTIEVVTYVTTNTPEIHLHVTSHNGISYRFYVTNHIVMGENEFHPDPALICANGNEIVFRPHQNTLTSATYPDLSYKMKVSATDFSLTDDRIFFTDHQSRDPKMLVLAITGNTFDIAIGGDLHGADVSLTHKDFQQEKASYHAFFADFLNHFHYKSADPVKTDRLNITVWWYLHNALIHYISPHGIEQYGGAAWGTRDVCQGPLELMLCLGRHQEARDILTRVYSHQFDTTGNWPQWFMFDRYENIQADESHGDIIAWPLKALSDYLEVTQDFAFLNEPIPYCDFSQKRTSQQKESLLAHVKKQLHYILTHTMFDTALSNYGNGDWDDTLQPANKALKADMVSSWTVSLTYQSIRKFTQLIEPMEPAYATELLDFSERIQSDFQQYLMADDVVSGFAIMKSKDNIQYLIHPQDHKTGITYRLLPMQRAMIAEMFSPDQVQHHAQLIQDHLTFQDGIRLVDRPVKYSGGQSVYFQRGEQAANFGREIGILYVHANIRYVEAMAKIGDGKAAWETLYKITPVGIQHSVKNAARRQANLYFSSSDADFHTRYDAYERFDDLKAGDVNVKGGWRLYSSGPGIYIRQLIDHCIGIRQAGDFLMIDPVLPDAEDFVFEYQLNGCPIRYRFMHTQDQSAPKVCLNQQSMPIEMLSNRYRAGGVKLSLQHLVEKLHPDNMNTMDIYL